MYTVQIFLFYNYTVANMIKNLNNNFLSYKSIKKKFKKNLGTYHWNSETLNQKQEEENEKKEFTSDIFNI